MPTVVLTLGPAEAPLLSHAQKSVAGGGVACSAAQVGEIAVAEQHARGRVADVLAYLPGAPGQPGRSPSGSAPPTPRRWGGGEELRGHPGRPPDLPVPEELRHGRARQGDEHLRVHVPARHGGRRSPVRALLARERHGLGLPCGNDRPRGEPLRRGGGRVTYTGASRSREFEEQVFGEGRSRHRYGSIAVTREMPAEWGTGRCPCFLGTELAVRDRHGARPLANTSAMTIASGSTR